MSLSRDEQVREVHLPADQALDRLAQVAEDSGATWHREGLGGRLDLPIAAGLRHGWQRIRVSARAIDKDRSVLDFDVEEETLALHRPAVAVLFLAGLGALVVSLWPFFPRLLPLAPIAAVLAVVGWLMVGARIRHHGLREFLELVDEAALE